MSTVPPTRGLSGPIRAGVLHGINTVKGPTDKLAMVIRRKNKYRGRVGHKLKAIDELDGSTLARYAMSAGRRAHKKAAEQGFAVSVFVDGQLKLRLPNGRVVDFADAP